MMEAFQRYVLSQSPLSLPPLSGERVNADNMRIKLSRRLMKLKKYGDAIPFLEAVVNMHVTNEANVLCGECAYELKDYKRALTEFQKAGPQNDVALDWVEKCEAKLGTQKPATAYAKVERKPVWGKAPVSLPGGPVSALVQDGDDIWIGVSHSGLYFAFESYMFSQWRKGGDPVESAGGGGLIRYNRQTGTTTRFEVGKTISSSLVMAIVVRADEVWVGTYGRGIDVFDKRSQRWTNWNQTNGLPSNFVQSLDADPENIWAGFGRLGKGAVAKYSCKSRIWHSYLPADYAAQAAPPTNYVLRVKFAGKRLWCVIPGQGLASYDTQSDQWRMFPYTSMAFICASEANGRMWFGGPHLANVEEVGLVSCNLEAEDWRVITRKDGLPEAAITALGAQNGTLTIGTYGLMALDLAAKSFTVFELKKKTAETYEHWKVTALLPLGNEVWVGFEEVSSYSGGLMVLKNP